ncbi:hypothetical protein AXG93_1793s1160 [Marchantia polymorpha subsp. ruderalis]|uniref:Uncharacterized protein n=1 Tax=Marchantia polymorpha subsp. ruderalis TaxID=1480154 RepID=A0A176WIN7_MARPO|nr:hypothetical protein AXG93_1793s1160 [Marchantia polymorpha subsp. ruderalis]
MIDTRSTHSRNFAIEPVAKILEGSVVRLLCRPWTGRGFMAVLSVQTRVLNTQPAPTLAMTGGTQVSRSREGGREGEGEGEVGSWKLEWEAGALLRFHFLCLFLGDPAQESLTERPGSQRATDRICSRRLPRDDGIGSGARRERSTKRIRAGRGEKHSDTKSEIVRHCEKKVVVVVDVCEILRGAAAAAAAAEAAARAGRVTERPVGAGAPRLGGAISAFFPGDSDETLWWSQRVQQPAASSSSREATSSS